MHNASTPVPIPDELHSAGATPMKWSAGAVSALARRMARADWWYSYSDDSDVRMAGAAEVRAIYKDLNDLAQSDMDAAHELWGKHAPAGFYAKPAALDEHAQQWDLHLLAARVISDPEPEDPSAPWIECRRFLTVAGKDPSARHQLDRFETVVEVHALVAYAKVRMHIHGPDDKAAMQGLFEAREHVIDLARFDAENDESTEPPFQYPDLLDDYRTAYAHRCIDLLADMDDSTIPEGHTLYCPRGCNQLFTTAARDECGVCGQTMLPENEDQYYGSLIAAGQCL